MEVRKSESVVYFEETVYNERKAGLRLVAKIYFRIGLAETNCFRPFLPRGLWPTETKGFSRQTRQVYAKIRQRYALNDNFVYIIASKSRTLYAGVTNNLERRVLQHREKASGGYTARYNINRLVYFEQFVDIRGAITREKQIKSWGRMKKVALIESMNRDWKDLSDGWYGKR